MQSSHLINHRGGSRIFNISSGIGYSLNDIIAIMRDELKIPVIVKYMTSRTFDVPVNVLDSSRLRIETGWKPQTDMLDGMQRVCGHLKRALTLNRQF